MIEVMTAGESHGPGMIAMVRGLPSGLTVDEAFIQHELSRRQQGYGRGGRQKIETDQADILSGVMHGKTTGSPVTLAVWNKDWENWKNTRPAPVKKPRPGHADLSGVYKYSLQNDIRQVLERASARETAARVAGGALSKLFLNSFGVEIVSHVVSWAGIPINTEGMTLAQIRDRSRASDLGCACDDATAKIIRERIDRAAAEGDTLGGIIEVIVSPFPPLLGSYQTPEQKLDARIAGAVLSVQAMKGIEFGIGFEYGKTPGKYAHDEIYFDAEKKGYYRQTNRAGGIEGGMSNGQPIVFRVVKKPIPTLMTPLKTVHLDTHAAEEAVKERSDVTALPAAGVVIENAIAPVLASAFLERYGADDMKRIREAFEADPALKEFRWNESV